MTDPASNGTHKSLYEALRAFQARGIVLPKDATNPHYSNRYTSLDALVRTITEPLAEDGLAFTSWPTRDSSDQPSLRYRLAHTPTGEVLEDMVPLMVERATPQGLGSALTYMRRYAICAVLNLVADDDDDGEAARPKRKPKAKPAQRPYGQPPPGAEPGQRRRIQALIKETGISREELATILGGMGVLLGEGWMDKLEPGPDGTAVTLIDLLDKRNRGMEA